MIFMLFILMTVAFLTSVTLTYTFCHPQMALYLVDEPNGRSLHNRPIPVSGGLAFLTGLTIAGAITHWFYEFVPQLIWIGVGGFMIAVISLIDDYHSLAPGYRLIIHFLAAILLLSQGNLWLLELTLPEVQWQVHPILSSIISLLFVIWMTNLYNFMDGMDGFAGGMALFGFGTFAVLGMPTDHLLFTTINLLITSSVAGFLIFNFPPARIFMGDTGASTLGFLAAAMGLWGNQLGIFPLWIVLLLFSPFIVDATLTLFQRLLRGERVWIAHKSHYYQRLVELGWGHRRTVLWEYGLMVSCSGSTLLALYLSPLVQWSLLIAWGILYCTLIYLVGRLEKMNSSPKV
jgi:UDP-N-acetylmuramyl pentapeptide phosphotransferase/UDP-N-acetylglucosamine-1-phosphate transferase